MNVGQLRGVLPEFADNSPVVLAEDEEGNGFNLLDDVGREMFDGEEIVEPDDDVPGAVLAAVLWP